MKKYKIIIDMRYAEVPNTGLTRFTVNIFKNLLLNSDPNIFYYLLLPPKKHSSHFIDQLSNNLKNYSIIFWRKKRGLNWKIPFNLFDINLYYLIFKIKPNLFISPYFDPPFIPNIKVIATIHDLIFLEIKDYFQNFSLLKRLISYIRIFITIVISDNLLVVSNATKKRLIERFSWLPTKLKKKVENSIKISNGIDFDNINSSDACEVKELKGKNYFLYVGDRRPHKNLIYLIEITKKFNQKFKENNFLVLAGSNKYKNIKLNNIIKNDKELIYQFIDPSDNDLDYLYKNCKLFFLISKEEGFGIPVIEAAARQAKIVISNIPSLREISPTNTCFINLKNINDDLNSIKKYLKSEIKPNSNEVIKKWLWRNSAKNLLDLIKNVLDS